MTSENRRFNNTPQWRGKTRSCTDLLCLLIFFVFMASWIFVGYFAIKHGNIDKVFQPKDSEGKRCGIDDKVLNKPYLVFFNLSKCLDLNLKLKCDTPQVCVDKCPSKNWLFEDKKNMGIEEIKKNILCKYNIDVSKVKRIEDFENLVETKQCARWYLQSKSVLWRCIPYNISDDIVNKTMTISALQKVQKVIGQSGEILSKIMEMKWQLMSIMLGSVMLCLFTIIVLKWVALPCVCVSIIVIVGILGYSSWHTYNWSKNEYNEHRTSWLCLAIFLGVVDAIIILITCCLFDRIRLACKIIKEASKAVMTTISSLFFPILPFIIYTIIVIYVFFVLINLYSFDKEFTIQIKKDNGASCICLNELNYRNGSLCNPDDFEENCKENGQLCLSKRCIDTSPWYIPYFYYIHIIGFIWFVCFVAAVEQLILACTFSTWYWTFNKDDLSYFMLLNGIWRTFRYHLGTAAFGSFIITIVRSLRYFLTFLQTKTTLASGNTEGWFVKVCCCCTQCCLNILEKLIKFINMNAYIMCAIYGKGLCTSATNGLSLLARNIARTVILNNVVGCILFAGKILITCIIGGLTWWYLSNNESFDDTYLSYFPVILICFGTYFVADMFFDVYEMAVDTIFLCFLQDCEVNDGSQEKPYFMTRNLAKIFDH